ncbi:MAG: hypothetical protein M1837_004772 [Sclerophora amabilis]|nr:MAG: hypothetical protein M1837_004772 [Sclerophora amabilis]
MVEGAKEAERRRIELPEDDLATIERVLAYLYTLDYDDGKGDVPEEDATEFEGTEAKTIAKVKPNHPPPEGEDDEQRQRRELTSSDIRPLLKVVPVKKKYRKWCAMETNPATEQRCSRLLNNVYVYEHADKYDIPDLKVLARKKFKQNLEAASGRVNHAMIIRTVCDTTPSSDQGLRCICIARCAELTFGKIYLEDDVVPWSDVVPEIENIPLEVLRFVQETNKELREVAAQQLARLRVDNRVLETTKKQYDNENQAAPIFTAQLDATIFRVNTSLRCGNCGVAIRPLLERTGTPRFVQIIARCTTCRVTI